ncbi:MULTISPECIES: hypothetical protein [Clostridium]|uniref:hypothetical protein n=1 Tax=Clostridium TaxID=1485 RepID=UPI000826CB48|nr:MULTISPECIES: hypothetical protein [Clostridium]PJI06565.1 hypothetical protein CUB90_01205 [Clostridium sp. CT7]
MAELTVEEMAQRLIDAQNDRQKAVEKAKEDERTKVELEKNEEIQKLKNELEVASSNINLLTSDKKELKKQLKFVEVKVQDKINEGITEKLAQLDFAPSILKICNMIDETVGGQVTKLNGIYEALGSFDDISKQRLYSTLMNLENNTVLIKKFLGVKLEENIVLPIDDSEEIIKENGEDIDSINDGSSDLNNTGLSMNF